MTHFQVRGITSLLDLCSPSKTQENENLPTLGWIRNTDLRVCTVQDL